MQVYLTRKHFYCLINSMFNLRTATGNELLLGKENLHLSRLRPLICCPFQGTNNSFETENIFFGNSSHIFSKAHDKINIKQNN